MPATVFFVSFVKLHLTGGWSRVSLLGLRVGAGTGGWSWDGEETPDAGWYNVASPPALTGRMRAEDSRSKLKQSWG
ncbi:hypothetical protein NQZ68_032416 [Dissostichus eleginoides]|nr:hypothetical protein NQZ68_032416 [Dissostichus eleginoides]